MVTPFVRYVVPVYLVLSSSLTAMSEPPAGGMVFLQFGDPVFRKGLEQHGMLDGAGYRLLNTGFLPQPFGEKWTDSPLLATARASGRPYYIDRIMGGMPFQSLDGIGPVADSVRNDPNFLGFQVHEWGNSPSHDYHRIHEHILDKGLPFSAESFARIEGNVEAPYFSAGDFSIYRELYRPITNQAEAEAYLRDYFKQMTELTHGAALSVTGFGQLYHTAFRLGARNAMAEIGNQVPLTALQLAFLRGAARQYNKPFGAYYEAWGGTPMGCVCATDFSPWWAGVPGFKEKMGSYRIGPEYGSGRSLHRRLLYFAWLAGSSWWSEEWGAENYFSNWDNYPLTPYGELTRDFQAVARNLPGPEPIVPVALVMPPDTFGLDIRVAAGLTQQVWRLAPADAFHYQMKAFADMFLAPQPGGGGRDAQNLTPSPWIGCFDVFDADVEPSLLARYACALYFTPEQAAASPHANPVYFENTPEVKDHFLAAIIAALPYRVDGRVGATQARVGDRYVLGLFNNLGITKTAEGETADPAATQEVLVHGPTAEMDVLAGREFVIDTADDALKLRIPAGELVVVVSPAT